MADHNDVGKQGEDMAADWLTERGFEILYRNWRFKYHEIDMIARKGKFLHFIEVKTRIAPAMGHPEDSVTRKKFRHLKNAADEFLFQNPGHPWIQYDILAITLEKYGKATFFLLEDVFL